MYRNVYHRATDKPGFHTNVRTKAEAINNLIAYVRDNAYIEHDEMAINEMENYELQPNGISYGAQRGKHDDILMTRAIGLLLIEQMRVREGMSHAGSPDNFVK